MSNEEVLQEALRKYGIFAQEGMLIEELGELLQAINKCKRKPFSIEAKDNLVEELADVSIMVEQMALFHGKDWFDKVRQQKIDRLKERLSL